MSAERRRLAFAFLLSLLFHTLLLSLTFSGQGLGLPGFGFPWRERRIEAPDLRVLLVPAQDTASTPASALINGPLRPSIEPPVARRPAQTLSVVPAPAEGRTAEAIAPKAKTTARAKPDGTRQADGTVQSDGTVQVEGNVQDNGSVQGSARRRGRCGFGESAFAHRRVR